MSTRPNQAPAGTDPAAGCPVAAPCSALPFAHPRNRITIPAKRESKIARKPSFLPQFLANSIVRRMQVHVILQGVMNRSLATIYCYFCHDIRFISAICIRPPQMRHFSNPQLHALGGAFGGSLRQTHFVKGHGILFRTRTNELKRATLYSCSQLQIDEALK